MHKKGREDFRDMIMAVRLGMTADVRAMKRLMDGNKAEDVPARSGYSYFKRKR